MSDYINDTEQTTQFDPADVSQYTYPQEQETLEQKEEQKKESSKEQNHRILRERAEAAERRLRELEQQLQSQQPKKAQRYEIEEDDDFDVADDEYVEGKKVKKILKKMDQRLKQTAQQFEEMNRAAAVKYAEANLKSQFADFDSIVTEENLRKLQEKKAPLFRSIMANNDLYDRGYSAYEAIKAAGIAVDEYEDIDRKLDQNRKVPRSAGSAPSQTSDSPMTKIGDYDRRILTDERKEQLRKQVAQAKMMR